MSETARGQATIKLAIDMLIINILVSQFCTFSALTLLVRRTPHENITVIVFRGFL